MSLKSIAKDPAVNARLACVIGCFFFVSATVMVWHWHRQREPVEVVFDPAQSASLPEHVTLKGIWLAHSDYTTGSRWKREKTYVAVRSTQAVGVAGTGLVLQVTDPAFIAAIKVLAEKENEKLTPAALKALATLAAKNQVTGVINSAALSSTDRVALREALPALRPGYIVLVEGEKPSLGPALLGYFVAISLILRGYSVLRIKGQGGEPPVIAAPPPLVAEPPLLSSAASAGFKQEPGRKPEAVDSGIQGDVVAAGIGRIKQGAPELLSGWLRTFVQADIWVVSTELGNPQTAFIFGPEGDRNYVAVFTRLALVQQCLREMPQYKFLLKLTGRDLLQLAHSGRHGIWLNPLNEAGSIKFPAVMMARFIKETSRVSY